MNFILDAEALGIARGSTRMGRMHTDPRRLTASPFQIRENQRGEGYRTPAVAAMPAKSPRSPIKLAVASPVRAQI
jgi:hypothetical protein